MHTTEEKIGFSHRLKIALKAGAPKAATINAITIQFNLRHKYEPVTEQAVQKWLSGKAIPSSDKIETLVDWLGVTTEWLRHGYDSGVSGKPVSNMAHIMLSRFNSLSERQQVLVLDLLSSLKPEE